MSDFLTFNTFITPYLLPLFYFLGAVGMPLLAYLMWDRIKSLLQRFAGSGLKTDFRLRILLWSMVIVGFLCMELCWRMLFEAMIAYFDMHSYLEQLAHTTGGV